MESATALRKRDSPVAVEPHVRLLAEVASAGLRVRMMSESELWALFVEERDPRAREELVRRHLPFAKNLARRYRTTSETSDDLLQVASLGLVNAIDRFDPARGIPFTAFASPTVLGELKRHFRDRVWTVRVPRALHDRIAKVGNAIGELTEELQRSPSVGEIAERLDLEETEVLESLAANDNRRPLSLDQPAGSGDPDETPASDWVGSKDEGFDVAEERADLDAALPHLSERERVVLGLRFVEDLTQSEIAERIGHSQMHVSRILRQALQRLREQIGEERNPTKT